jgi:hypothetical protein
MGPVIAWIHACSFAKTWHSTVSDERSIAVEVRLERGRSRV